SAVKTVTNSGDPAFPASGPPASGRRERVVAALGAMSTEPRPVTAVSARESVSVASRRAESRRPFRRSPSPRVTSPLVLDGEVAVFDKGPGYLNLRSMASASPESCCRGDLRVWHERRLRLPTSGRVGGVTWLEPRAGREPRVPALL